MHLLKLDSELNILNSAIYSSDFPLLNPFETLEKDGFLYFILGFKQDVFLMRIDASKLDEARVLTRDGFMRSGDKSQKLFIANGNMFMTMLREKSNRPVYHFREVDFEFESGILGYELLFSSYESNKYGYLSSFYDEDREGLYSLMEVVEGTIFLKIRNMQQPRIEFVAMAHLYPTICEIVGLNGSKQDILLNCNPRSDQDIQILSLNLRTTIVNTLLFKDGSTPFHVINAGSEALAISSHWRTGSLLFFQSEFQNVAVHPRFETFSDKNITFEEIERPSFVNFVYQNDLSIRNKTRDTTYDEFSGESTKTDLTPNIEFNEHFIFSSILSSEEVVLNVTFPRYVQSENAELTFDWSPLSTDIFANLQIEANIEENLLTVRGLPYLPNGGVFRFILKTNIKSADVTMTVSRIVHFQIRQCVDLCRVCKHLTR